MKKFLIILFSISGSFLLCAGIVVVVLASVENKVDISFANTNSISIYDHSLASTSYQKGDEKFDSILTALSKGMKESKLDQINDGHKLNKNATYIQELNAYSSLIKDQNLCLELHFDEEQSLLVYDGNNTKKITYTYLLIVLDDDKGMTDHVVYYGTGPNYYQSAFKMSLNDTKLQKNITK